MKRPEKFIACLCFALIFMMFPSSAATGSVGGAEGWITISCNVDGASVFFDSLYQGQTRAGFLTVPVYTTGTPFGEFSVLRSGYTTYTGQLVMPAPGETRTFYATLGPVPTPTSSEVGSITADSFPSGAQVYFNGEYRGTSPLAISDVYPGTYTISMELTGYRSWTTSTTVFPGSRSSVSADLQPATTTGSLSISSNPPGSSVYLDGLYKGITPVTLTGIAAGTHAVQLDHAGFYDWRSPVTVPSGGKNTLMGTLNPLQASTAGGIAVSSTPGGASVSVDGKPAGLTPGSGPLQLTNIPVGDHTVTIALGGYEPYSVTSSVIANTVSRVSVSLTRSPSAMAKGALFVSSTPAGADVYLDDTLVWVTPLTLPDIPYGGHTITIRLDGFSEYSAPVQVNSRATTTVSAALSPVTPVPTRTPQSPLSLPVVIGALCMVGIIARRQRD